MKLFGEYVEGLFCFLSRHFSVCRADFNYTAFSPESFPVIAASLCCNEAFNGSNVTAAWRNRAAWQE
jgi:hypothetical protein